MASVKILVVEDEVIVAKDIADILKSQGYDVPAIALSGEQAIEKTEQIQPDLVLMDIVLKGDVDGIEAAEQIRRRFDIPVLYLTAYTDEQTVKRAKITEPFGYITKPFDKRELRTNIEMALYKHKAEEALRASEERYRNLFENAGEGIITLDLDGRITGANRLIEEYGFNRAELLGRKLFEFVPEYDKARSVSDFQALIAGRLVQGQMDVITPKGIITVEYRDTPMVRAGEVIGVQAILTDITERKKMEEELREKEKKWASLTENTNDFIMIVDNKGKLQYINKTIPPYTPKESVGKSVYEYVPKEQHDTMRNSLTNVFKTGKPEAYEVSSVIPKLGTLWFSTKVVPIKIEENVVNAILMSTDITERKRAEEAYRTLVDHSLQGLAILQDERVVFTNQALADITGHTVEEMLAMTPEQVQAFVHTDDRELVWNRHRDRLNGEELPERYEFRGIRKDGSACWLELHASRIEYQGKPAIQAAYVDITERKRAEEEVIKSEARWRSLVENSPDFIYMADYDGKVLFINRTFPEHSKNEVIGKRIYDFLAHEYHDAMRERIKSIFQNGCADPLETSMIRRDGTRALFETRYVAIKHGRKVASIMGIATDVTERKRAEEALMESEEKFKSIFEHANDGVIYLDTSGNILDINEKAAQMFGGPKREVLNKHFTEVSVFSADEIPTLMSNFERIFTGEEVILTVPIKNKKGQELILECSASLAKTDDGAGRIMVIARDITERIKASEQIAKLAKFPAEDPNPVLRISGRGTVIYANKASANLLKTWDCRVGKSLPDRWNELVMDALSSGQSQQTEVQCDGRTFSLTFAPVVDANYINVYGHDITERKKAEQELARALAWQEAIFEGSRDAVFVTDADSRFVIVNHAACELTGYSKQELLRMRIPDLHEEEDLAAYNLFHERIMAGEEIVSEAKILRKDGIKVDTEFNNRRITISGTTYMHTAARDITERKKAEERLLEHQAKLKAMASEMLLTEEHERQRLAVGLHDSVCQKLVLTKLALESSLQLVSDSKVLASLRIVCEGIGETIEQADSLTFELSNPVLHQLGFVIALEKYLTEEIQQKYGIEYELESDEQLSTFPDEIKNCLFRVTRELLTNVVKHAHARKVKVSARESQSQIYVRVQDDGVGFKESQAGSKVSQTARFGLFSIREQLEYLGGHLEIESEPGQGTTATVVVPLRDKATV